MKVAFSVGMAAASLFVSGAVSQPLDPAAGWAPMVVHYDKIGTGAFSKEPVLLDSDQSDPLSAHAPLKKDPTRIGTGAFKSEPVLENDPQQLNPTDGWKPLQKVMKAAPRTN